MIKRRWLLALAVVLIGASMSLAIACSDDDDGGGGNDNPTATHVTDETPSETMGHDETPVETMGHDETPGETMSANEIHVRMEEYTITDLDTGGDLPSPQAGTVVFEAHNEGLLTHEFVVIKTDLPEGTLPTEGGLVDEEGDGIEIVDEIEGIAPDDSEVLSVDLEPGNYVVICNVEGHYAQGMHASLTVM